MLGRRSSGTDIGLAQVQGPARYGVPFALFVGTCCLLAFVPVHPDFYPQAINVTLDAIHFPAAALLYLFLARLVPAANVPRGIALALALSIIAIVSVELLQAAIVGRHADASDVFVGAGGVLAGLVLGYVPVESGSRRILYCCSGIAIGSIIVLVPATMDWVHVVRVNVQPNSIATFEWPGAARLWEPQWGSNSRPPKMRVVEGDWPQATKALEVQILKGGWSGVSTEFTSYRSIPRGISFTVANPMSSFELFVQLIWMDSSGHEETEEQSIQIGEGIHTVTLHSGIASHTRDVRRLQRILFYGKEAAGSRRFYLDDIKALMT